MTTPVTDRWAIDGKFPRPGEHAELLVVGGGPAGCAAAAEAARGGVQVVLVDENPVGAGLIGLDVPLLFGGRATPAVQNRDRMVEQVLLANPALADAYDAGVDVRLGTCIWGAWVSGPGLQALPVPVAGLADEARSWMIGFDRLIVAAGARDLVLSFQGSDLPGVVGAQGFYALLARYGAFAGRRIAVLGSGPLAVDAAVRALDQGLDVAAMIEVRDAAQAPMAALQARGIEVLTGTVPLEARGGVDGAQSLVVAGAKDTARTREIACDTVVSALGAVPMIELLDVLGAKLRRDPARGGFVPDTRPGGATSLPAVFVAGDVAGLGGDAAAEGRDAARAVLRSLGRPAAEPVAASPSMPDEAQGYALDWARALLATGGCGVLACTCEEVTRAELLGLHPPRYLGWSPKAGSPRDLGALLTADPVNQDQVKRLTRAGMGPCQGRRCREQVSLLLALGAGVEPGSIPLASYRAPVRPLPLSVLADGEEGAAMAENWTVWFGIPAQWIRYEDIGTEREAELIRAGLRF